MIQDRFAKWTATAACALAMTAGTAGAAEFRWSFQSNIAGLDAMSTGDTSTRNFLRNVYEGLVMLGPDMQPQPALATSWETVSETLWRFELRPDVVFHDGSEFTADDVVFSFQRGNASTSDMKSRIAMIADIRKVDDLTVEIETDGPAPTLLIGLTYMDIFDEGWATENEAAEPVLGTSDNENYASRNANGTGPFQVVSFDTATGAVIEPHEAWWGEPEHNITRGYFQPISTDETRVAALLSGQVDMMFPVPQQDAPRIEASPDHRIIQSPEDRVIFLGMDQARDELLYSNVEGANPFKDIRVRQAVYQAIDTELIREKVMRGAAGPIGALVTPFAFGYHEENDTRLPYDPEASKELLAEAGYPDGFEVTIDCPNDRYHNDEQICVALASMLAEVGIELDVLAQTRNLYFSKIGNRDTSFYIHGWSSAPDALSMMRFLLHSPTEDAGSWNVGSYANERVDELIDQLGREIDQDKRNEMFKEAFAIHREEIGVIPLHTQMLTWGVREGVEVRQRADSFLDLRYVMVD